MNNRRAFRAENIGRVSLRWPLTDSYVISNINSLLFILKLMKVIILLAMTMLAIRMFIRTTILNIQKMTVKDTIARDMTRVSQKDICTKCFGSFEASKVHNANV